MRRVFADTLYWVAMTHRKDQWYQAAVKISRTLAGCRLVTTDEILTEVLAAFCEAGPLLRHHRRRRERHEEGPAEFSCR
jgi:predicted nucleic acid-binding protein